MRSVMLLPIAALVLAGAGPAYAKGCIRGAIAGGGGGPYVGKGHALAGAAAGCVAVHHHYAKKAAAKKPA
ncbi:hypothetical protein [Sphingomonas solaris]|uniref:Glycine zipper 2TM domain-containing protein n=1 Tax=Alterirhizorhabdus solaris TaxID=2529389 RepID=A0A558R8C7_9SPHN|nr:hypothetical protein [Sphingomonas solaris]TVV75617.1 hypothetical protein FOY91_06365 [Sphingomonas solaris]